MKNSLFKLTFLFLIITSFQSKAAEQRVFGFLGDWHSNYYYTTSGVQYDYMTDIVFAFILPEADGSFAFDINSSTWYFRYQKLLNTAMLKVLKFMYPQEVGEFLKESLELVIQFMTCVTIKQVEIYL